MSIPYGCNEPDHIAMLPVTIECELQPEATASAKWEDAAGKWWVIAAHAAVHPVTGRIVVWTATEEAGVDDIDDDYAAVTEMSLQEAATEHVTDIASGLHCGDGDIRLDD